MQPGLISKRLQTIAENRLVPDCSSVVTARAFVTVNLLIERFEMSVYYYYYYYYYTHSTQSLTPSHPLAHSLYSLTHSIQPLTTFTHSLTPSHPLTLTTLTHPLHSLLAQYTHTLHSLLIIFTHSLALSHTQSLTTLTHYSLHSFTHSLLSGEY